MSGFDSIYPGMPAMTGGDQDRSVHWLADLFDSVDARDTARFVSFLSQDAEFRFGSAPPVSGHEQIAAAVDGFFSTIAGLSHRIANTWIGDDTIACEGDVTYRRHNGSDITLPFVNVFDMSGDKVLRYKIYIDITPLYAD